MSQRGALYVATGRPHLEEALRSAASLRTQMPDLPITLFSDQRVENPLFEKVIPVSRARRSSHDKIVCLAMSPYERTLYLDADTFVCGELSGLFPLLEKFDLAAAHSPNRRAERDENVPESFPEFQAGVVLFRRSPVVIEFLRRWLELYEKSSQGITERVYDQPSFRRILYGSALRLATLAPEYNCRVGSMGYVCGEVKILHGRRYPDLPGLARRLNAERGRRLFLIAEGEVHVIPAHSKREWLERAGWYKIKA